MAWHTRSVPALEDAAQALDNASPEEQTLGELLRHFAVRLNERRPMPQIVRHEAGHRPWPLGQRAPGRDGPHDDGQRF